jgi:hypothetical protein
MLQASDKLFGIHPIFEGFTAINKHHRDFCLVLSEQGGFFRNVDFA